MLKNEHFFDAKGVDLSKNGRKMRDFLLRSAILTPGFNAMPVRLTRVADRFRARESKPGLLITG